ncbi:pyocin knob domain-containing protein [Achromobacter kerstersii]|uniref:pyocin knob domain-containing protein n=1 Tax=Achromobacter kerstersii TaxID=1353890 RepID=UPI00320B2F98
MPTIQTINVGLAPNDGKGEDHRSAFQKVNLNSTILNTAIQGVLDGKGQANGYASLGADGRLLAAQAPVVYSAALPTTTHDLNTYVTPGTFYQTTIAGATAGANYPVLNVGFLEVVATGTPVLQVYTVRSNVLASMQRFWRVRQTAALWSAWKEISDTSTTLSYQGGMAAAQDLNDYTQRGMWAIASSSIATGGTNFPIGNSGTLVVYSAGYPGGSAANNVNQVYFASNTGQTFTRSLVTTTWTPWVRSVDSSQLGAASGAATLNAAGQLVQTLAPARALGASENLNDVTAPGSYYMNSNASATAALNYPALLAGLLEVEAAVSGNVQIVQRYTTQPVTNPRTFVRLRFASSLTWGAWFELARFDQAMTHTYILAVATDANTLVMDNMWWSWANSVVMSGGSNFPPAPIASSGILTTQVISPTYMVQTCMLTPGSNRRPIEYRRIGNGTTTWSAWRLISPVQLASDLPTADCGDAIVDGLGLHRWNGAAYELASLSPAMPTTAHDLNTYQTPGTYFQSSAVGAAAGTNYPIAIGGWLTVTQPSTGGGTAQEYVARNTSNLTLTTGPRRFWRVRDGGVWSAWQEVLSTGLGMTHVFLSAATDANTLIADNTFYTWTASAVAGGANFPGYSAAGYMQVFWHAATVVSQELTLLVTGGKPLKFARFGNASTGVWQPWKVTGAFNSAAWLPTSNMGDIYVDGEGWYAWNGSAYKLTIAGKDHGQCRFQYVSATQCRLVPWNGNGLIVNGRQLRVPASGVNLARTGLAASTLYYVYAYDNAGAIALEGATASYAVHSDGVRIKTGDPTRTLVGMVMMDAAGNFLYNGTNKYVTTWFNRLQSGVLEYIATGTASFNNAVQLNNGCGCLTWAGDNIDTKCTGQTSANSSAGSYISLRINDVGVGGGYGYSCPGAGAQVAVAISTIFSTGDGVQRLTTWAFTNINGTTVYVGADNSITFWG